MVVCFLEGYGCDNADVAECAESALAYNLSAWPVLGYDERYPEQEIFAEPSEVRSNGSHAGVLLVAAHCPIFQHDFRQRDGLMDCLHHLDASICEFSYAVDDENGSSGR